MAIVHDCDVLHRTRVAYMIASNYFASRTKDFLRIECERSTQKISYD